MTSVRAGLASVSDLISSQTQSEKNAETVIRTLRRLLASCTGGFISAAVLLLLGSLCNSANAQTFLPQWNQLSPSTNPPERYIHAMTYDAGHQQVVLFGGFGQNSPYYLNDTWLWNGTNWTQANPTNSPDARGAHAMAYDAAHGQVVMFGGTSFSTNRFADTWLWDGTNWTQANPGTSPSARDAAVMVYDPATSNVVLFGGSSSGGDIGDTWTWDGTNWTKQNPGSSPSARSDYSMVYDPATGNVVLFGGDGSLNDTWTWDGTNWTQQFPASAPPGRADQGMAYDAVLGEVVMWGGQGSSGFLNDTWAWNGSTWTQLNSPTTPPAGRYAPNAIAYDAAQNQMLLFSGQSSTVYDDTWTFGLPDNFGNINVCPSGGPTQPPCNSTMALNFGFSATSTTVGSVKVVTQGQSNLDFNVANTAGTNCGGNTWSAGSSCTVLVTFTPVAPGLRLGAVELLDGSGNLLVTAPIYGIGQGAVAAAAPLSATVLSNFGSLTGPKGVVVDAADDVFVSDYEGHKVVELNASNQLVTVVQSPQVTDPQDLALDGAGDLFIADTGGPDVLEVPYGCTSSSCQKTIANPNGLTGQFGVSVDQYGDVFVSAYNQGEVVEVPANGGSQTVVYTGSTPIGTAVDAAGDLYVADAIGSAVAEVPAGCANSGCYVHIGSGWSAPQSVTLDAAGDLYVADSNLREVLQFPAGCTINTCAITIANTTSMGSNFQPYDATVDGQGNVYIADHGNQQVEAILQQNASLTFAQTNEGSISTDSPKSILFQNIGNEPLDAAAPGLALTDTTDYRQVAGSGTPADCTSTFLLAPGAPCNLSIDFQPDSGNLQDNGAAQFTDNAVFNSGKQSIALSGSVTPSSIPFTLTVSAQGSGSGAVTDGAEALNCTITNGITSGTCTESYSDGQLVTLTATANGSTFEGWGGACANFSTNPTCTVTMSAATNVTVVFAAPTYTLSVTDVGTGSGTVTDQSQITCTETSGVISGSCAGSYPSGTGVTLTATASGSSTFAGWGGACASFGASATCNVTVNSAQSVSASFVAPGSAQANLLATITAGGVYGQGGSFTTPNGNNGGISANSLYQPENLAVDGGGNLYVADLQNSRVLYYPSGSTTATRVYGQNGSFTNGSAPAVSANSLNNPYGLALDSSGDLYIADWNNSRVLFYPAGSTTATRVYGQNGSFTTNTANNGGVSASSLNGPQAVALDSSGDLYVADTGNSRILFYPVGSTAATRVYGQNGSFTTNTPNNGGVSATSMNQPFAITLDSSGDLYVADDQNSRVLFYPVGSTTATRVYGQNGSFATNTHNNGGVSANSLYGPQGVALDSGGNLYVADYFNSRVLFYPAGSTTAARVYGQHGSFTSNSANTDANSLSNPAAVVLDSTGNLYVADKSNNRVLEFGPFGNINVCQSGQSTPAPCSATYSLSYYASAETTFGSTQVLTQGAPNLDFTLSSGSTCTGTISAGNTCLVNVTFAPTASGLRMGAVEPYAGGPVALVNGVGNAAVVGFNPATQSVVQPSGLQAPSGVAVDAAGNIFISDENANNVVKVTPGGSQTTIASGLSQPYDVAVDGAGNVFIADFLNNRVLKVTPSGAQTTVGTGMAHPSGVAVDGAGDVFITNENNSQVVEVTPGGVQTTVPTSGISGPYYPAVDAAGDVFFVDSGNQRVVKVTPGGVQSTVLTTTEGPNGVAVDAAGDIFISTQNNNQVVEMTAGGAQGTVFTTGLSVPAGVAVDGLGNLFIADHQNGRVVKVAMSQAATLNFGTVAVNGRSSDIGPSIQNIGTGTLTGTVGTPSNANFVVDKINSTCTSIDGISLTSGATCVLGVYASPLGAGAITGTVPISDNSLNGNPAAQTIPLQVTGSGTGINYSLTVSPIGSGTGTVTDNTSVISCQGANGSVTGTCSSSYSSGSTVTLTANAAAGSIFLGWGGACTGLASTCQVSITGVENVTASFDQQNFGNINVCQPGTNTPAPCNTGIPVTINVPTTTTIGAIQVVTQGATGLDFTQASGGTCTGTITGGTACTVNVQFAPIAVGLRTGAVELYNATGGLVASAPIYGVGQAPLSAFSPAAQLQVNTGTTLNYPNGLLTDAASNLFISDGENQRVLKIAPNGIVTTVPTSGLSLPQGLAEDGAGDLFIADNTGVVTEIPAGCTNASCQISMPNPLGLQSELGVAVDPAGNLFIGDFLDGKVAEVPANGGPQIIVYNPTGCGNAPGCSDPVDLTTDSAGDLFIADFGLKTVAEVPPGCTTNSCVKQIGTGWSEPDDVAVDAAGDVFVADQGLGQIVEVPFGCTSSSCQIVLVSNVDTVAVKLDAGGNVFFDNLTTNQVFEVARSLPPALGFATSNIQVASTDSPKSVSVQNIGNQNLSIYGVSATTTSSFSQIPSGSTCSTVPTTTVTVMPGKLCNESFSFTPQTPGIISDSAIFSDNTLNLTGAVSVQAVDLNGIGSVNGATGTVVPNVLGLPEAQAAEALAAAGLKLANVSSAYSSSEPSGTVAGENPAAGSQVNLGTGINLLISTGQAPAPAATPLTFENNYFVTGDFATAGTSLRGMGSSVTGIASGTITIPDSTTGGVQGVPDGADIVDGFLYWETLENTATPSGNAGTFLGYAISGQQVGVDAPYTDGALSGTLRIYRADVNNFFQSPTAPINFNGERLGSGPFSITLPDAGASGFPRNEGASLVVIYRVLVPPTVTSGPHPSYPLKSVVIYDGASIPTSGTMQNVSGFYDATGANAEVAVLYNSGGTWNSTPSSVALGAHANSYSVNLNSNNAYAAVIFSTPVNNSDNDGILDAWKNGPAAPDFFAGEPGYYDAKTQSWVALPGAMHGEKDLFVQLDYMCGNVSGDSCASGENLLPVPDAEGNDPLAMVTQAFKQSGITLHLELGNAVQETECTDTAGQPLCSFPGQPGVIGWKNSLEFSKVWPRNYTSCAAGGDCTARFPYGQKDSYHYVLFGHSLAIPAWSSRFGSLVSIATNSPSTGETTITTTSRGAPGGINYCPTRFTLSGILSQPSINGVYNTVSCPDGQTIILTTPNVATWSFSNNNPLEPDIGLTSGTVTSISGYSDLGGQDSAVSLGIWEDLSTAAQNMGTRANVIAGTLFHEIGHTIGLSHGGIYYQGATGSYIPTFDINCKPNYLSSMNYLFQLVGVGPNGAVAYSNQTLETLTETGLGGVTNLVDINSVPATYSTSSWYQTTQIGSESPSATHCDGTPLNTGESEEYFVPGYSIAPVNPAWMANQNITYDGQQPGSTGLPGLVGYNDVANVDLRQVGATGGEFASLSSVLAFGNSSAPVNVASGSSVNVGAGGTVTVGKSGSVSLSQGGNVTVGGGAVITGGGQVIFNTGGNAVLSSNASNVMITAGSSGMLLLPVGGNVTLNTGGTITMPLGGTLTIPAVPLGPSTSVTFNTAGSISIGGNTVTIPAAGGAFTIPNTGGTITLNNNGSVLVGAGGNVTMGGAGNIAMGGAGNVTMGGAGNVTLGGAGTITMGGAGSFTLTSGGNITMGGAGSVALANGGTITMGGAGNVTMGGAGTVTMGGAGDLTVGTGASLSLAANSSVTVGVGGTVTMGGAGTITMGGAGNVTMGGAGGSVTFGGLGGTVTMGGAGNVTLGGAGTITMGGAGNVTMGGAGNITFSSQGGTITMGGAGNVTMGGAGGPITLGSPAVIGGVSEPAGYFANLGPNATITFTSTQGGTVTMGGAGTVTMGGAGNVTMGGAGTITMGGAGGSVSFGSQGGNVTMGGAGTVTMGGAGNITMGGAGTITMGGAGSVITMTQGGTITMGGAGNVTMGGAGVVSGLGGNVTLGGAGNYSLSSGGGGTVTMGGAGSTTNELDYMTANSVVYPPAAPTYAALGNSYQVSWMAPAFGVVQTYTITRSVLDSSNNVVAGPTVIGSVSGVIIPPATTPTAPATTFTDTNPPSVPANGKLIYTIATTLVPDTPGTTPRTSVPSAPAVVTLNQAIVLGPLPSSVVLQGPTQPTTITVTATAETNGSANMQLVSFSTSGPCSAGTSTLNTTTNPGQSSATITMSSTGSCTVIASQGGDSTTATTPPAYSAASPVSGTFMILPQGSTTQSQSIIFGTAPNVQYGSSGFSVSASATPSGLPVNFSAPANGPCTVNSTTNNATGSVKGAGLCTITATAPASNNYSAASVTQSFNIAAAPLTVAANSFTEVYGVPLPGLTYTFGPLVNNDSIATAVTGAPALSTTATPLGNVGSYPITVSTGTLAAANYSFYYVNGTMVVTPATTATTVASSSSGNNSNYMQEVTFTATVVDNSPSSLGAAPTGTITFFDNGTSIGTANLAPVLPCSTAPCASQAMFSSSSLGSGANAITVSYSGDAGANGDGFGNYYPSSQSGSKTSGVTQSVSPVPVVSLNPVSLSFGNINVGQKSSATIMLTNAGDANLSLPSGSFTFTGPNMGDFTETNNCPTSLSYTGSNSCTITVTFAPSDTGVEMATLQITDNDENGTGAQQFVSLTGSGLSSIAGTSVFTDAVFSNSNGCGAITVSGGSSINSFNSSLGAYSSSKQNSGGNVGTNGNITIGGGSTIYGSAAANVLTTGKCSASAVTGLTTSGGASVTGGLVALNGPLNYPAPLAANPAPPTTNQTISGSCPSGMTGCSSAGSRAVNLAPGEYGNVTASGGTTVYLSAGTYYFNSLKIGGGSLLQVNSGPAIVNLAGTSLSGSSAVLDFTGGGMENTSGIAGNLQFKYGGSQALNLLGGAYAYAAVFAPNAPVNLSGGTDFFGSITGSTVTSSGGTLIHYDTNLPSIPQGRTIWFSAVVNNVKGLPSGQQVKLYLTNGTIKFTAAGTQYTVPVPNAVVTLDSTVSGSKSTSYDLTNNRWSTSIASTNLTGNTFVTGVAFPVPVAFPAGIQNVTWSASFSTDTPGITLQWQWNAEVYTSFSETYATSTNNNVLGVNGEDGSADAYGTDPAGVPETYKADATFGATDGYFSATSGVVPTVAQVSVAPSSLNFGTQILGAPAGTPLTAVLTNNYASGFTISSIAVSGTNAPDFHESDNCPRTASGFTSSCTISVTFTPLYATAESAKIVITDTANNSPQTVFLSGTGQQ